MRQPKRTCHYCNEPATGAVQSKPIRRLRFICREQKCWTQYWKDCDTAEKGDK